MDPYCIQRKRVHLRKMIFKQKPNKLNLNLNRLL